MSDTDLGALARYQAALLAALADAYDPSDVARALLARKELAAQHDYVRGFEPRAVEIGMTLVHQWGERALTVKKGQMRAPTFVAPHIPLEQRVVAMPTPGPGEVRIRVHASGICGTDLHMWRGEFAVPTPVVPGHEPVGVIDALGAGVTTLQKGDRVGVSWVQAGCGRCAQCAAQRPRYCATPRTWARTGGGHAQWMLADARGVTRLPDALSFEHAAPLFCAGYTVMSGYRRAQPRPGDRVAVLGVGGLGHLALQIARALGHEVIAITSSESKRREALALGAHEVLAVREHAGRELAAIGGADIVLGTSSDLAQTSQVLTGLRPEGRLVTMALPTGDGARELSVEPRVMLARQLSIVGAMQSERADLVELLALAAAGRVVPQLELFPIGQIGRAMSRLAERRVRYRAVLVHDVR